MKLEKCGFDREFRVRVARCLAWHCVLIGLVSASYSDDGAFSTSAESPRMGAPRTIALDRPTAEWLKKSNPGVNYPILVAAEDECTARIDSRAWKMLRSPCTVVFRGPVSPLAAVYLERLDSHGIRTVNISRTIAPENRLPARFHRLWTADRLDGVHSLLALAVNMTSNGK